MIDTASIEYCHEGRPISVTQYYSGPAVSMALVLRSPTDAPPVQRWKQAYSSSTEEEEDIQEAAEAEPDMNNTAEQQEAEQCKYPRKPTRQASRLSQLLWKMSLSATILTLDLSPDQPEPANMRR